MSLVGKLQGDVHQCCDRVGTEDSSGEWHLTKSGSPGFLEEVTFDCPLKAKAVVCQIERRYVTSAFWAEDRLYKT